jgi:hypothetical protein
LPRCALGALRDRFNHVEAFSSRTRDRHRRSYRLTNWPTDIRPLTHCARRGLLAAYNCSVESIFDTVVHRRAPALKRGPGSHRRIRHSKQCLSGACGCPLNDSDGKWRALLLSVCSPGTSAQWGRPAQS